MCNFASIVVNWCFFCGLAFNLYAVKRMPEKRLRCERFVDMANIGEEYRKIGTFNMGSRSFPRSMYAREIRFKTMRTCLGRIRLVVCRHKVSGSVRRLAIFWGHSRSLAVSWALAAISAHLRDFCVLKNCGADGYGGDMVGRNLKRISRVARRLNVRILGRRWQRRVMSRLNKFFETSGMNSYLGDVCQGVVNSWLQLSSQLSGTVVLSTKFKINESFEADRLSTHIVKRRRHLDKKVGLLLSGGVDSAVAAALLVRQGYDVTAYYLYYAGDGTQAACQLQQNKLDASFVAHQLGVKLCSIDVAPTYKKHVLATWMLGLRAGITPNPDALCNRVVKFGDAGRLILHHNDYIASGHYAVQEQGRLSQSTDRNKDQTYFLCLIDKEIINKMLFPIGKYKKTQVRRIAARIRLHVARKPESMGVCLLGIEKYKQFVSRHIKCARGPIVDHRTGIVVGHHLGHQFWTVGQSKGLGNYLLKTLTNHGPWKVVDKRAKINTILVGNRIELDSIILAAKPINWLDSNFNVDAIYVKIRHSPVYHKPIFVKIINQTILVQLPASAGLVAPGQVLAVYSKKVLIAGAPIYKSRYLLAHSEQPGPEPWRR